MSTFNSIRKYKGDIKNAINNVNDKITFGSHSTLYIGAYLLNKDRYRVQAMIHINHQEELENICKELEVNIHFPKVKGDYFTCVLGIN